MAMDDPPGATATCGEDEPSCEREGTAEVVLRRLRCRYDRFCRPGEEVLEKDGFAALMAFYSCCPPEAASAFFHAFREDSGHEDGEDEEMECLLPTQSEFRDIKGRSSEGLAFPDFVRGVCAADPQDTMPVSAKARYYIRFLTVAPTLCFRFE